MIVECPGCGVHFEMIASGKGPWSYHVVPAFAGVWSLVCKVRMDAVRGRHRPCPYDKQAVGPAVRRPAPLSGARSLDRTAVAVAECAQGGIADAADIAKGTNRVKLDQEIDRCIQALQAIKLISATHSTASKEGSDRVLDVVMMLRSHRTKLGITKGLCPAVADGIYRCTFNRELPEADRHS